MKTVFHTKITSWGNSYGLRIPKDFIDQNSDYLKHSLSVLFDKKAQGFVIKPTQPLKTKEYFLQELTKMKPAQGKELNWGKPVGKEIW